jgi:hypothetical protein
VTPIACRSSVSFDASASSPVYKSITVAPLKISVSTETSKGAV